jgi:mono/diheme cytochrome c family protein
MRQKIVKISGLMIVVCMLCYGIYSMAESATTEKKETTVDTKKLERGRYLSKIAGCNDCHTPGYLMSEGKTPETQWLTGEKIGWRGPWGTTYAINLRIFMDPLTEDAWVTTVPKLKSRPPMPWFGLAAMTEEDLRSIHQFIKSLAPLGNPAPAYVPPDQEPKMPYVIFPAPPK